MTLPVLVINRDRDTDRWAASLAATRAQGIEPVRVPAEDAHAPDFRFADHARLIRSHFWDGDTIKPGAIGCFLSHRKAWREVVDQGWSAALILEDDADLREGPERIARQFRGDVPPDLLFANDRLADWARQASAAEPAIALDRAIRAVARGGGPRALGLRPAPGADAYAVTRNGARCLLALTDELGIVCGVDWAMIWLALTGPVAGEGIEELRVLARVAEPPGRSIRAAVLARPVATLRGGPSVLKHRVEVAIADLPGA